MGRKLTPTPAALAVEYGLREDKTPPRIKEDRALWRLSFAARGLFPADADPDAVFWKKITPAVEQSGGWSAFDVTAEDAEIIFLTNWAKMRYGLGRLAIAAERAERCRLIPSRCKDHPNQTYTGFISLCGWLQAEVGDQPIYLPCRKVGELLHCSPMTVSRCRLLAQKDGFLALVREDDFGLATEFRFDLRRFPRLRRELSKSGTTPTAPTALIGSQVVGDGTVRSEDGSTRLSVSQLPAAGTEEPGGESA